MAQRPTSSASGFQAQNFVQKGLAQEDAYHYQLSNFESNCDVVSFTGASGRPITAAGFHIPQPFFLDSESLTRRVAAPNRRYAVPPLRRRRSLAPFCPIGWLSLKLESE